MTGSKFVKAYKNTEVISVPVGLTIIFLLYALMYWNDENFWKSTLILFTVSSGCFIFFKRILFKSDFFEGNKSKLLFLPFVFAGLFVLLHYILYFTVGILSMPVPLNAPDVPITFFIGLFGMISLTIYYASLGLYMISNNIILSSESYTYLHRSSKAKIKTLRQQMNPHLITNTISNVKTLIRNKQYEEALQYCYGLRELSYEILNNSKDEFIKLRDEINWIEFYLKIEQLRVNHSVSHNIDVEDSELLNIEIPAMILQPIIENCILHGFNPDFFEGNGVINIRIRKIKFNGIAILITDNGLGIKATEIKSNTSRASISTDNIESRIDLINQMGEYKIRQERKLHENGSTTEIIIYKY